MSETHRSQMGTPGGRHIAQPQQYYDEIEEGDDADSNTQEGKRSDDGDFEMVEVPSMPPLPVPGPKHQSIDTIPSFGNRGPLPSEDYHQWNAPVGAPWNSTVPRIPASPGMSQKAPTVLSDAPRTVASPKPPSRAGGRPSGEERPLSPLSTHSHLTKEGGSRSMALGVDQASNFEGAMSPKAPSRHKASSVAPSEPQMQAKQHTYDGRSEFSPHSTTRSLAHSGQVRQAATPSALSNSHQNRPFSPYRMAATHADLVHAAARGRALPITEEEKQASEVAPETPKAPSIAPSARSKAQSVALSAVDKVPSKAPSAAKAPSVASSRYTTRTQHTEREERTPRPASPNELNPEEAKIVHRALAADLTPRTSYYEPSAVDMDVANAFHDQELCILLHKESDPHETEVVKKAMRKAIKQRIKRLGMKYDNESIRQFKKAYHNHDPSVHAAQQSFSDEPPQWAADIKRELVLMQQRIESLGPKIEGLKISSGSMTPADKASYAVDNDELSQHESPMTQTVNIHTQTNSMYQVPETEIMEESDYEEQPEAETGAHNMTTDETQHQSNHISTEESNGRQFLSTELYKLQQKGGTRGASGSQSGQTHQTWEVAQEDENEFSDEDHVPATSKMATIPDTTSGTFEERTERDLPPLPDDPSNRELVPTPQPTPWDANGHLATQSSQLSPWQRIHQRLLSWAIIWPSNEFDHALNSTTRGHQVDEVALSIWATQTYKRYVRARLTESPQGVVDRLFVPPNMADAISTAVFNGRHGDACNMLRELWHPFGLEGMPRLLVVLAKHRSDENHWVVHRFSLPDGGLTTYDCYPERTLPDGRVRYTAFSVSQ
ncbi:hypothetical protein AX16_002088 [Volvariella volvacea WC 439]|nr:hypothetical protein AX16_002088 [Volvariella volvacea WC 439]